LGFGHSLAGLFATGAIDDVAAYPWVAASGGPLPRVRDSVRPGLSSCFLRSAKKFHGGPYAAYCRGDPCTEPPDDRAVIGGP